MACLSPISSPSIKLPLKADLKSRIECKGLENWLGDIDQNLLDKAEIKVKAHLNYIYTREYLLILMVLCISFLY